MKKCLVLVLALAGCNTAQLDLDSRWPTNLAASRADALRSSRPCVIFLGIGDSYDHNLPHWQAAFLESVQADNIRSQAVLVATRGREEREAICREYPFLQNLIGPYVLVLDAKGELLAGFSAYGIPLRSRGEPSTDAFVAMLATKIGECLRRGFTVPDLARRLEAEPTDIPAARELIDRYQECFDLLGLRMACQDLLDRKDVPDELKASAAERQKFADAVLRGR